MTEFLGISLRELREMTPEEVQMRVLFKQVIAAARNAMPPAQQGRLEFPVWDAMMQER